MAGGGKPIDSTTILLVEDNAPLLRNVAFILQMIGFKVLLAADGTQALEMLRCCTPDLIISDLDMPGLNGYGLLRRVRADQRWGRIPFIMISDRYDLPDLMRALELGASDYVPKPFDIYDLLDAIKETLQPRPFNAGYPLAS
ncbi:MAG: response regulator [Chloroflexi bacterium]|nr:response regulator [Chloroflexota bacterium]MDL1886062.1 response regulator [Anaerolineae bacterium CFX8]